MWKPGDVIAGRGIYRERVWNVVPAFVVADSSEELVLALIPGTECMYEENYAKGKKNNSRRSDYKDEDWVLKEFVWRTNRVLSIVEPEKYYSIMFFWNHEHNKFLGYYVNFQLPFKRSHCGFDTLDLDLDIHIEPDLSFHWKDEDDYQIAVDRGVIFSEWIQGIEDAKKEIFDKLERRQYPFDGAWLNWMPDPNWSPPKLPLNWDKI
jgi:predicted RNA-binding protein associated with RNAse of E/G family